MGLMDKPKKDFEENYVFVKNFIFYLAFRLEEPVETVVSWLLYNDFDEDITSYEVDKHYRVYEGDQIDGVDKNIDLYFEQISLNGYYYYYKYLTDDEYHFDKKEMPEYDYYEDVNNSFYLRIDDLKQLDYLNELDLNIEEADKYDYQIYSCDSVTATLPNMNLDLPVPVRTFRSISMSLSEYKELEKIRKESTGHDEKKELNRPQLIINGEGIRRAIEYAASGKPLPSELKELDQRETEIGEVSSSHSQDKKLIAILALLLANKSKIYTVGNKKPNATQISKSIYEFAIRDLRIADEDMNGLKAPISKISQAIQEYTDILYKRPELKN